MGGRLTAAQFLETPAAWADADLAGGVLSPGLRAETARALLTSRRTGARANAILAGRLGGGDMDLLAAPDRSLALAGADGLRAAASLAGAIWHAPRVRALVLSADIAALAARHGGAARLAAMQHAALAGPLGETEIVAGSAGGTDITAGSAGGTEITAGSAGETDITAGSAGETDITAGSAGGRGDLADDIARDGAACIDHWIDTLPAWAAARLRLIWPRQGGALPDPARAVRIVHAAAVMVAS